MGESQPRTKRVALPANLDVVATSPITCVMSPAKAVEEEIDNGTTDGASRAACA